MKKKFYVLLLALLALPVMAYGQDVTSSPVASYVHTQDYTTIQVEGDGILSVQVLRDHCDDNFDTVIDEAQVEGTYVYTLQRSYDDGYNVLVTATAQEDGKLPSEEVTLTFMMRPYFIMPMPEISFYEEYEGVYIDVSNCAGLTDVTISSNGELVVSAHESYGNFYSYFVPRSDCLQEIFVDAINRGTDVSDIARGTTAVYMLMPNIPMPEITTMIIEDYVFVNAFCLEGEVHLLLNDEEVSNPYAIMRGDEDQVFVFTAYSVVNGMQSQIVEQTVVVPAIQYTAMPIVNLELLNGRESAYIELIESEPSTIYYRYSVMNEDGEFDETIDFQVYNGPFTVTGVGTFRLETYADAVGKMPSGHCWQYFTLMPSTPTVLYDFEEDGVFYKITAEGKVSVCSETTAYNSYSGEVIIPATVTHDGVTYMVTGIADNAFSASTGLTDVSIGAYVTAIGDNAFHGCTSLTGVTLGDYVISVGEQAFAGCSALATVKMGSGLASIGAQAFQGCAALTSVACKAATPPVIASSDCFECYGTATLSVYPPVLDSYRSANYWNQFVNIVSEDRVAPDANDTNGDGVVNVSDAVSLINHLLQAR